jgi:hypothetical protein
MRNDIHGDSFPRIKYTLFTEKPASRLSWLKQINRKFNYILEKLYPRKNYIEALREVTQY